MAFSSFSVPGLWTLSLLTILAASVQSNLDDDDPLQPMTSDETVSVGGTVTLTCRVAESDNSSLQWSNTAQQTLYFGEKRALRDNRIQLHRSTPTELSITIGEVQLSDEGDYTCSIFTMPVRTARATVTVLGVPGKPQITGFEDAVQEGSQVTLTCTSTGSKPPAKLHWYRGGHELQGRPDVVESNQDEPTYTVISELTLTASRADDNAMIACAVDHPSLSPGDKRTEQPLRVLFSPDVHIQPESDLPREGEKFHLQCMGNGNPEPMSFMWEKKDGGELPPLAKADGSFLRFEALNKSDNGVYVCQADNGVGKSKDEYTLLVQDQGSFSTPSLLLLLPSASPTAHTPSLLPGFASSSSPLPSDIPLSPPSFSDASPAVDVPSTPLSSSLVPDLASPPEPSSSSSSSPAPSPSDASPAADIPATLSNSLFPDLVLSPDPLSPSSSSPSPPPHGVAPSVAPPSASLTPSVPTRLNGVYSFTAGPDNVADTTAMTTSSGVDHAVIGGVVAVIVFILLCLLIVLGRYLIRHKGTYLTHEAKGSDDAPDADTAIINAEGGHSGAEDKKEYFI